MEVKVYHHACDREIVFSAKEIAEKTQTLMTQEIFIKNELQRKSEELKAALFLSERLHRNDLLTFAIGKASKAEEQLEVSREQIETLEEELRDAGQELEYYHKELDACHQEMIRLAKEM